MRVFITDDEADSRALIRMYLQQEFPTIQIVGEARGITDTLEQLKQVSIDLLFLDIELPSGTGFDILDKLKLWDFHTIFITAYDHFAVNAIKHNALDYILKPIERSELVAAVKKAFSTTPRHKAPKEIFYDTNDKIKLPTLNGFKLVDVNTIIRCEADGNYTRFKLRDGNEILVSKTLKTYEDCLTQKYSFIRVHQAHIVNTQYINEYIKGRGGEILLEDGSRVSVSESRKKYLISSLGLSD